MDWIIIFPKIRIWGEFCTCRVSREIRVGAKIWPEWVGSHPVVRYTASTEASQRSSRWLRCAIRKWPVRIGISCSIHCAIVFAQSSFVLPVLLTSILTDSFSFQLFFVLLTTRPVRFNRWLQEPKQVLWRRRRFVTVTTMVVSSSYIQVIKIGRLLSTRRITRLLRTQCALVRCSPMDATRRCSIDGVLGVTQIWTYGSDVRMRISVDVPGRLVWVVRSICRLCVMITNW